MGGAVNLGGAGVDELQAAGGQLGQAGLLGGGGRRGRGGEVPDVVTEDSGIDGIGFGAPALGAGEVADAAGFDHVAARP